MTNGATQTVDTAEARELNGDFMGFTPDSPFARRVGWADKPRLFVSSAAVFGLEQGTVLCIRLDCEADHAALQRFFARQDRRRKTLMDYQPRDRVRIAYELVDFLGWELTTSEREAIESLATLEANSATRTTHVDGWEPTMGELMHAEAAAEYASKAAGLTFTTRQLLRWARSGHLDHLVTPEGEIVFTTNQLDGHFADLPRRPRTTPSLDILGRDRGDMQNDEVWGEWGDKPRLHLYNNPDGLTHCLWVHPETPHESEVFWNFVSSQVTPLNMLQPKTRVRRVRNLLQSMGWTLTAAEEATVESLATVC